MKLFSLTNDRNLIESSSKVGTFKYMPPEMLKSIALSDRRKFDSEKGDVWSMGIILYKMLFGK